MGVMGEKDVCAEVRRRLLSSTGAAGIWSGRCDDAYPMDVTLGVTRESLRGLGAGIGKWSRSICELASKTGCTVTRERRKLTKSLDPVDVPVRLHIPGEDEAVRVAGRDASAQRDLRNGRHRAMRRFCLEHDAAVRVLRDTRLYSDADFSMLVSCAEWASSHDTAGLTPRQVPVPGVQGKFLDSKKNRELVAMMAGKESLGLSEGARYVLLKYLDPDSPVTYGLCRLGTFDEGGPPYRPRFAIIVENKQTFSDFPAMADGVCVYGAGKAAVSLVPAISWLRGVPRVFYWGDMDSDGLEILAGVRERGLACESVLMDLETYERFERLGTSVSAGGGEISAPDMADRGDVLLRLTDGEASLYEAICAGRLAHPRIEQEKIPFDYAVGRIGARLAEEGAARWT